MQLYGRLETAPAPAGQPVCPVLVPYQVGVPRERPAAHVAAEGARREVHPDVERKLRLGGEVGAARGTDQRLVGNVGPAVGRHVALDGEPLLAQVARVRPLPRVHASVCV